MEGNGYRYIELLCELYNISEQVETKMRDNVERISAALKDYFWADIERQVSVYFAYKSDKTYPKIAQIVALLRADKDVRKINMEDCENIDIAEPSTNIAQIRKVYLQACEWLHRNGVMYFDYFGKVRKIPYGNKTLLKERTTSDGRREHMIWNIKWDCDDAIVAARQQYHDVFVPFDRAGGLSFSEEFAFAVTMGFFKLGA